MFQKKSALNLILTIGLIVPAISIQARTGWSFSLFPIL
ncbi:hypothetical protein MNBD_DELTA03-1514, partial [hydrothermal vent metagenome]